MKCVVIGLDGATFDIINPLIKAGKLPTIKRLMSNGSYGKLQSTILPNSFPGWASCTTGTSEGMHGIFSPFIKHSGDYGVRAINSFDIQTFTIWDLLKSHGKTSGVINIPTTYPPEEVNGYQITGMLTPSIKSNFTYPPTLRQELLQAIPNYIIEPRRALERLEKANEFRQCFDGHLQAAEFLIKKYPTDFFMIVFSIPDRAQHDFWADMDKTHFRYDPLKSPQFSEFINETYIQADQAIAQLLRYIPDEANVILCSDHGFCAELREIRVNELLAQHGFLHYKKNISKSGRSIVSALENKMTYHYRTLSTKFKTHNVLQKKVTFGRDFLQQIDWKNTKAYFGQDKGIWINLERRERSGTVNESDFEQLRKDIQQTLLEWVDPETNTTLFQNVLPRESLLKGHFAQRLPDLLLIPKRSEDVCLESFSPGAPVIPATTTTGTHAPDGIFIAYGPNIRRGEQVVNAQLRDITPTALYLMNLPLTTNMDGKPIVDAIALDFINTHPIKRNGTSYKNETFNGQPSDRIKENVFNDQEASELEERLRALGYLG